MLVEFCSDVLYKRIEPYRKSDKSITEPFDKQGVRTFNAESLNAYFENRLYLEQELAVLFHADNEEADEIFEVLSELALELRHHSVYKLLIGKINMNHNEPSEHFSVHTYPSIHLFFKSKDGHLQSQRIITKNKRELIHLVFQHSQVLSQEYDDKIYYQIM